MSVDFTGRQDHNVDSHAPVKGSHQVRDHLHGSLSHPRAPQPDAFFRLVDPAAQLFGEMVFVVQVDQVGVAPQCLPDVTSDPVIGRLLGKIKDLSRSHEVNTACLRKLPDSVKRTSFRALDGGSAGDQVKTAPCAGYADV